VQVTLKLAGAAHPSRRGWGLKAQAVSGRPSSTARLSAVLKAGG
jgi:hypothetical protein